MSPRSADGADVADRRGAFPPPRPRWPGCRRRIAAWARPSLRRRRASSRSRRRCAGRACPSRMSQTRSAHCSSFSRLVARCTSSSDGSTMASVRAWSVPCSAVSSWPMMCVGPVLRYAHADEAVERRASAVHMNVACSRSRAGWTQFRPDLDQRSAGSTRRSDPAGARPTG